MKHKKTQKKGGDGEDEQTHSPHSPMSGDISNDINNDVMHGLHDDEEDSLDGAPSQQQQQQQRMMLAFPIWKQSTMKYLPSWCSDHLKNKGNSEVKMGRVCKK